MQRRMDARTPGSSFLLTVLIFLTVPTVLVAQSQQARLAREIDAGTLRQVDPALIVPNPDLSIRGGAIAPWSSSRRPSSTAAASGADGTSSSTSGGPVALTLRRRSFNRRTLGSHPIMTRKIGASTNGAMAMVAMVHSNQLGIRLVEVSCAGPVVPPSGRGPDVSAGDQSERTEHDDRCRDQSRGVPRSPVPRSPHRLSVPQQPHSTPSRASLDSVTIRARSRTASSIGSVSRPVKVFCCETW